VRRERSTGATRARNIGGEKGIPKVEQMKRVAEPIDGPKDIPAGHSDEERMAFLEEHGVLEYFLGNVQEATEKERPLPRTRLINVRFDDFTLTRLKEMAERRNVVYQTLLKALVVERLYEEERRDGVLPVSGKAKQLEEPGH
jgi:hypothetical protein